MLSSLSRIAAENSAKENKKKEKRKKWRKRKQGKVQKYTWSAPKGTLSQASCDVNPCYFVMASIYLEQGYSVFYILCPPKLVISRNITWSNQKHYLFFLPYASNHHFRHLWIQQCHFSFPEVKWNLVYQKATVSLFLCFCFSQPSELLWSCSSLYLISFLHLNMLKSTLVYKEI